MAMTVRNVAALVKAGRRNAPLRSALELWRQAAEAATWSSLIELRRTFPSADGVTVDVGRGIKIVVTVFNIKGNEYRLIAVVNYAAATVLVIDVLTHAEYGKDRWKDRL
jgi:mRNA interferase HigB